MFKFIFLLYIFSWPAFANVSEELFRSHQDQELATKGRAILRSWNEIIINSSTAEGHNYSHGDLVFVQIKTPHSEPYGIIGELLQLKIPDYIGLFGVKSRDGYFHLIDAASVQVSIFKPTYKASNSGIDALSRLTSTANSTVKFSHLQKSAHKNMQVLNKYPQYHDTAKQLKSDSSDMYISRLYEKLMSKVSPYNYAGITLHLGVMLLNPERGFFLNHFSNFSWSFLIMSSHTMLSSMKPRQRYKIFALLSVITIFANIYSEVQFGQSPRLINTNQLPSDWIDLSSGMLGWATYAAIVLRAEYIISKLKLLIRKNSNFQCKTVFIQ